MLAVFVIIGFVAGLIAALACAVFLGTSLTLTAVIFVIAETAGFILAAVVYFMIFDREDQSEADSSASDPGQDLMAKAAKSAQLN